MRRVLFWMHLGTGTLVSIIVIFFSVTGALLAYERPIVRAADQRSYAARSDSGAARLPLDTLIAQALANLPSQVETVTTHQDPSFPVEIQTADRNVFFIDPYQGQVTGPQSPRLRGFFAEVTALHRWFGLSNASHAAAVAVKGATAFLLLFLILSGSILWMPRIWTQYSLRAGIAPRFDGHTRALNLNWHKVTGFWLGLPLAVIVTTGVIMAYPWANALLFHLARSPVPQRVVRDANIRRRAVEQRSLPTHLDQAFADAVSGVPDWQSATLRLAPAGGWLNFTVDRSEGGHPEKRVQVIVAPATLVILHREPFQAQSRGQRWRVWVRFIHTGEAGGWWGETLAVLTALGAVVLSVTGVVLALNRLQRWQRRTTRA
jgi:uncharacterized iron-regulated membrane protein